jgi:tetratricopeptide (TPR) repeat protein
MTATIDQLNDHAWEILRQLPDSAERCARQAIALSSGNPPYPKGLINGHTLLGISYKDEGFLSLSVEHYLEALKWAEEAKDSLRISSCLNNIGVVYQLQENFEKAMEYFEASLQIEERLGKDPAQKSIRLFNIGEMHERLEQHDKAYAYYYQSLLIEEQLKNSEGIFYARLGLGRMHTQRGNLGDGARELGIAEKWEDSLHDPTANISLQLAWGALHHRAGDNAKAKQAYEHALSVARKNRFQRMEMDALEGLVQQYRESGEYDRAMALQDSFLTLVAAQNSATVTTRIAELQFRYELKKKEQEIAQLQEQEANQEWNLKRERNMRIYLLVTLLLAAGITIYRVRQGNGKGGETA